MKRATYSITPDLWISIAPTAEMVRCSWCGIAITPAVQDRPADDVVTIGTDRVCVRCGMRSGIVVRTVVEAGEGE